MSDRQETMEDLVREIELLRESEKKWRQWFEDAPIPLEQDYSEVKRRVDEIKTLGAKDLETYFGSHPDLVRELAGLVRVVDVNRFTLHLYRAGAKEDLLSGIDRVFSRESYDNFIANLMAVAEGRPRFSTERIHTTLEGEILHVQLHWAVVPGHDDTCGRVLVNIFVRAAHGIPVGIQGVSCDITEQKRAWNTGSCPPAVRMTPSGSPCPSGHDPAPRDRCGDARDERQGPG